MPIAPKRKRSNLSTWALLNIVCALGLIVIVMAIGRYGVPEFFARFEGKPGGPANSPKIVRPGNNLDNSSGQNLPTIVRPGINSENTTDPKLPTIVRLSPGAPPSGNVTIQPRHIEIVDGDTVAADGKHYRLAGIDTPEKGSLAKCATERQKAERASQRLREIVAEGNLSLTRVSCNCPPNTEGTGACNYGRLCGVLKSNGRDVGLMLVNEGLAKRYDCGSGRCPPKQSWCS